MGDRGGISSSRLALGAMLVSAVLFGAVCSVNNSGLAGSSGGGTGGKASGGSGGHAGARGGSGGSGGSGSGGIVGAGGSATGGHGSGGTTGAGGSATGGSNGTGGMDATGGTTGAGGTATGGSQGTGGLNGTGGISATGGTTGSGGVAGGTGTGGTNPTGGTGGTNATGGAGGMAGLSGAAGAGGIGGSAGAGGHGGAGGGKPPSCASFPSGASATLSDGHLHCYWAHGNQIDWTSAEAFCENEGGTLATILSSTENMVVLHLATQANLFANPMATVFIGGWDGKAADDRTGVGTYTWVTGEPWGFHNWFSGQPDGTCTGCGFGGVGCSCDHWAAMASDGTWYDRTETPGRAFICEAIAAP